MIKHCLKCGAHALPDSEMCFAHATTEERGGNADRYDEEMEITNG